MSDKLTAISLFTGAGGMDIGFEKAGVEVVFANELVSDAAATYNANHASGIMVNDDVNNIIDSLKQYDKKPSQIALSYALRGLFSLERIMGVEPTTSAWEANVLPINYIRKNQTESKLLIL